MNCAIHPDAEAIGTCTTCGQPLCEDCRVDVNGKNVCRSCLALGKPLVQPPSQGTDVNTAFILELLGGFFGLLGIGYLIAGYTNDGILRLVIWMIVIAGGWIFVGILSAFIIGLCLIPVMLAIQIGVPIWSATELKKRMLGQI